MFLLWCSIYRKQEGSQRPEQQQQPCPTPDANSAMSWLQRWQRSPHAAVAPMETEAELPSATKAHQSAESAGSPQLLAARQSLNGSLFQLLASQDFWTPKSSVPNSTKQILHKLHKRPPLTEWRRSTPALHCALAIVCWRVDNPPPLRCCCHSPVEQ